MRNTGRWSECIDILRCGSLPEENMTAKPARIVVTGLPGSGKTTLAEMIGRELAMCVVNVGDRLVSELSRSGVALPLRREAGAAFLDRYGIEGYLAVLDRAACPGTILDGVRLARGVQELRRKYPGMIHLHRLSPSDSINREEFGDRLVETGATADLVVPWQNSISGLATHARSVVLPFVSLKLDRS